jgi:hypothetical protein
VQDVVEGCTIKYMEGGGPDPRCYRVNCDKIGRHLPGFRTEWTVRKGAEELYQAFVQHGLTEEQFDGYTRLKRIQQWLAEGQLDDSLRRRAAATTS